MYGVTPLSPTLYIMMQWKVLKKLVIKYYDRRLYVHPYLINISMGRIIHVEGHFDFVCIVEEDFRY